jgi:hypothetical protein
MNVLYRGAAVLAFALVIPSVAFAELRRVDVKIMGMD